MDNDKLLSPHISYKSILEQIQDGIFIADRDLRVQYWNQGAERLLGYRKEEVVGTFCLESRLLCDQFAPNPEECIGSRCPLMHAIHAGFSGTFPHLLSVRTKHGDSVPVSVNVGPIHDDSGQVAGGICVFRDMREEYRQKQLAGEIQRRMVTTGSFERNGLFIETVFHPVDETGGDFIETFFLDDGSLFATSSDATGHGISAALFTMIYKSLLHASLAGCRTPGKLLELINEKFLQTSTVDGFYLTASIVRINPDDRTGLYASAGHPPAMTFHRHNGGYALKEVLDNHAFMIGIVDGLTCTEQEFALEPGEFMILASDGIFEADGPDGKPMGRQGIIDFFADYTGHLPAQDLFGRLLRASPYGELADDASIVCVGPLA
jgi:hypothetical protein